jgi:hypothetical protein
MSDIDDATRLLERDVLDLPVPACSTPGRRRDQLKNFVNNYFVRRHNRRRRASPPIVDLEFFGYDFAAEDFASIDEGSL